MCVPIFWLVWSFLCACRRLVKFLDFNFLFCAEYRDQTNDVYPVREGN